MDKRGGRAAQSFSCHLTLAQLPKIHPPPIHVTSFLWLIFQISGKADSSFSTKHLAQNKSSPSDRCVKGVWENILPPFHPLLMHTSKQMTFPYPDVFHSWVKETWGWGWGTRSSVSTVYFLLFLSFLCSTYLISLWLSLRVSHQFKLLKCQTLRGYVTCQGI